MQRGGGTPEGGDDRDDVGTADDARRPLVVDLDGTLHVGDVTLAATRAAFGGSWRRVLPLVPLLIARRGRYKQALQDMCPCAIDQIEFRPDVLAWLASQRLRGRRLFLATGADGRIARGVAGLLGMFEGAWGSDASVNLVGARKAAFLMKAFPDGFVYAGDSHKDLAVWRVASGAVVVGDANLLQRVHSLGVTVEAVFPTRPICRNLHQG